MLVVVFLFYAIFGWRGFGNFLVDFGREAYIPWRLVEGDILYRDVASLFGPFSQHWNAMLFRWLGVSITVLFLSNLLILAALAGAIYDIFRFACDRLTATLCCASFLVIAGFPLSPVGIFNYVAPYAHEMTHGIAAAVGMTWCLVRVLRGSVSFDRVLWGLAGALYAVTFLTKPEAFVAATAALTATLVLSRLSKRGQLATPAFAVTFGAGFAVPLIVFLMHFLLHLPPLKAVGAVAGAWTRLLAVEPGSSFFYHRTTGLVELSTYPLRLAIVLVTGAAVLGVALLLDRKLATTAPSRARLAGVIIGTASWTLGLAAPELLWHQAGLPLPWLTAGCGLWLVRRLRSRDGSADTRNLSLLVWVVLSLALMLKILLNTKLFEYGAYLAVPGFLSLIAALVYFLPRAAHRRWKGGSVLRAAFSTAMVLFLSVQLIVTVTFLRQKQVRVGTGGDVLRLFERHEATSGIVQALEEIRGLMRPAHTLAVLPEGVMFNYLTRRRNPTPYINLMPPELRAFGEASIIQAFEQHPPDFVLLVHKDIEEFYGVGPFGEDPAYGEAMMAWVGSNYARVGPILNEPLTDDRFGIALFSRRKIKRDLEE